MDTGRITFVIINSLLISNKLTIACSITFSVHAQLLFRISQQHSMHVTIFILLYRLIIKDNVDVIRLQKQLSEKSTSLLVLQEKSAALQEVSHKTKIEKNNIRLNDSASALLLLVSALGFTEQIKPQNGNENIVLYKVTICTMYTICVILVHTCALTFFIIIHMCTSHFWSPKWWAL